MIESRYIFSFPAFQMNHITLRDIYARFVDDILVCENVSFLGLDHYTIFKLKYISKFINPTSVILIDEHSVQYIPHLSKGLNGDVMLMANYMLDDDLLQKQLERFLDESPQIETMKQELSKIPNLETILAESKSDITTINDLVYTIWDNLGFMVFLVDAPDAIQIQIKEEHITEAIEKGIPDAKEIGLLRAIRPRLKVLVDIIYEEFRIFPEFTGALNA